MRRILHPLPEVLLLVVCGTIADCDDYEDIAAWGAAHLDFLRRHLPYEHGVPGERWLTILMNRINPALFAAAFAAWVRESWPEKAGLVAIDGKTSRRSHDRSAGAAPAAPRLRLRHHRPPGARPGGRARQGERARRHPAAAGAARRRGRAEGRARLHRRHRHQRRRRRAITGQGAD